MRDDPIDLTSPSYTPVRLINATAWELGAKDDAMLARILECHLSALSRVRNRQQEISTALVVRILDRTNWSIKYLRELAGMPFDGGALVFPAPCFTYRFPQRSLNE